MSGNINGIQPIGTFQYNPYPMSGYYSDFDNIDLDYSTYPMMGMNGSIFTGAPMFGGIGGMMPSFGGIGSGYNAQDYFNQMKEYQQFYNQYNIDQQKMQRNADLQLNGSMESVQAAAHDLKDKIVHNEQDQIKQAYDAYIESVKHAYGEGTEGEITSRALTMYSQMNGKTLIQDLRDNGHSSFAQGLIQSMTLGFYAQKSSEDNISEITGQPVATTEKVKQNAGRVAGAVTLGGIAYGLTKALAGSSSTILSGVKSLLSGKAGIVGLAVGVAAAALAFITGKATS